MMINTVGTKPVTRTIVHMKHLNGCFLYVLNSVEQGEKLNVFCYGLFELILCIKSQIKTLSFQQLYYQFHFNI